MGQALTRRQKQILWLMLVADGPVMITGGTREFHWYKPQEDHPAALVIRAYQDPDLFLARRGLIEVVPQNAPGRFYRMTPAGHARACRIGRMPR